MPAHDHESRVRTAPGGKIRPSPERPAHDLTTMSLIDEVFNLQVIAGSGRWERGGVRAGDRGAAQSVGRLRGRAARSRMRCPPSALSPALRASDLRRVMTGGCGRRRDSRGGPSRSCPPPPGSSPRSCGRVLAGGMFPGATNAGLRRGGVGCTWLPHAPCALGLHSQLLEQVRRFQPDPGHQLLAGRSSAPGRVGWPRGGKNSAFS